MTKGYLVGGVLLGFPVELAPHSPYILSNSFAIRTGHATEFSKLSAGRGFNCMHRSPPLQSICHSQSFRSYSLTVAIKLAHSVRTPACWPYVYRRHRERW